MGEISSSAKSSLFRFLGKYGLIVAFTLVMANIGIFYSIGLMTKAQTCFTPAQVLSDSRCLYILNNKVYEKGTRSSPHHGHNCGMDVTTILPSFHNTSPYISLVDQAYRGDICALTLPTPTQLPLPTSTVIPTRTPTSTPIPINISTPTSNPSRVLTPTLPPNSPPTITQTPLNCPTKVKGDANCDGKTDGLDYSIWFNSQCHPTASQRCTDLRADFNVDGSVDDTDYLIWFANRLNTAVPPGILPSPVLLRPTAVVFPVAGISITPNSVNNYNGARYFDDTGSERDDTATGLSTDDSTSGRSTGE